MDALLDLGEALIPTVIAVVLLAAILSGVHFYLERRLGKDRGSRFQAQLILLGLTLIGLVLVLLVLPVESESRSLLLGVLGLLGSGVIALSSTTMITNVMAGILLRILKNFKTGDFIQIDTVSGRVSERGLFHTEVQTEDRDLVTVPNAYLVSHPLRVIQSTGTVVSAQVSLGYDVPRNKVKSALLTAAHTTRLSDPFVQVLDLGDFSVTYRLAGMLVDTKHILTARSQLRAAMLDALHAAQIEIVSPNFMNTRALSRENKIIPNVVALASSQEVRSSEGPEDVVFDKAELAQKHRKVLERIDLLKKEIDELEPAAQEEQSPQSQELVRLQADAVALERIIAQAEDDESS